jgi:hypothetical protein
MDTLVNSVTEDVLTAILELIMTKLLLHSPAALEQDERPHYQNVISMVIVY